MIREICRDTLFLSQKSATATLEDLSVAADLLDTLTVNADHCVGMAANMIGVAKRIIAVDDNGSYLVLFNPEIVKYSGPFEGSEGCLSPDRHPKSQTLQNHQSAVPKRKISDPAQDLYGLDGANYPARNRPLQRDFDLEERGKVPTQTRRIL